MIPKPTVTDKGIIAPPSEEVLQGLWAMFVAAFGPDIAQVLNTPQGQMSTSLTASFRDRDDQMVQLMNQIDPQYSTGIWQDAIARLYFLTRQGVTRSTAQVTFFGLAGSVIPQGFQVQDQAGNVWVLKAQATIQVNGEVVATVECQVLGAISASPNTITIVVEAMSGVDRVTNPSAAIAGKQEESRDDFEIRRADSVSANAKNTDSAVRGSVANLPSVIDVWVKSNHDIAPTTMGVTNYPVPQHSILVSAVGGIDYDIAWQILVKAGSGCGFAGNTEVTVTDSDALTVEAPTYSVKFLRPTTTTVKFKVTFDDITQLSYPDEQAIKNSILTALQSGRTRARIAQNLRAVQYVSAVTAVTDLELISIEVSLDGTTWVDRLQFGVDQFPVSSLADITVA
jgi:hypothetical protein